MAKKGESTKHLLIDVKTGFAYGVKMSADGVCEAAQPLNVDVQNLTGDSVRTFGPLIGLDPATVAATGGNPLPYGQTTFAVELAQDGSRGNLFTIAWPSKEDAAKGIVPQIAIKKLPENLIDAGFAARPASTDAAQNEEEALRVALKNIDDMIGLGAAKRDIKQNIAIARFNKMKEEMGLTTKPISRHMVFTGNPGTGKTTFAREVAKVYHALGLIGRPVVHEVKREDLVAGYIGQTAIKTSAEIDKAVGIERDKDGKIVPSKGPKGGVLFIDEAYALSREAGASDSKDFGREAIDTLVAAMENMRDDLVVIVAGYTGPMKNFIDANPGLKSRFMTYIDFADYKLEELADIMDFMLKDRGYTMSPEARDHALSLLADERARAQKDFGNGRTVRNLVEMAEKELALRLDSQHLLDRNSKLSQEDLKAALTSITLADVERINLRGLSAGNSKAGMDFGQVNKGTRSNDNTKAPPRGLEAVPAAATAVVKKAPRGPGVF